MSIWERLTGRQAQRAPNSATKSNTKRNDAVKIEIKNTEQDGLVILVPAGTYEIGTEEQEAIKAAQIAWSLRKAESKTAPDIYAVSKDTIVTDATFVGPSVCSYYAQQPDSLLANDLPPPADAYPRVTSTALRDAARRLVELSRDGDAAAVGYELRLLATFVVAPAAEDAQDREAMERGNSRTGEKP